MPINDPNNQELTLKNKRLGLIVLAIVIAMIGLSFAAIPLYSLFCSVTGFGGTTQTADTLPSEAQIIDREITINFTSNTNPKLPWDFKPEQRSIAIKLGQRGLTAFSAKNKANHPTTGTAIYNVTPLKAGKYFNKIQCFCFDEQTLQGGEQVSMPVMFYVDPKMADDRNMIDVKTITLSYTFFEVDTKALEDATEAFYND